MAARSPSLVTGKSLLEQLSSFDYLQPHLPRRFRLQSIMAAKRPCRETSKVLKFCILWILGFLPFSLEMTSNVSDDDDLEITNLLKKMNKPYVKSIQSPDGSIIDCVLLHLQPAFDNPVLRDHKLMTKPSFYPEGYSENVSLIEKHLIQPWHAVGMCPEGTTPIRRKTKKDLLRAKSIPNYGKKTRRTNRKKHPRPANQTNDGDDHEYAIRTLNGGTFYGTKATLNVWIPFVQIPNEFSLAQIWVSAGDHDVDLNTIEAGWQVYNDAYEDDNPHLFGFWTNDSYESGCYNLECQGFIQISNALGLGSIITPASDFDSAQVELKVEMFQDRSTRHWWLKVANSLIGYWPGGLFTHLRGPATSINWGGEIVNKATNGKHTSTEMGSGLFSSQGYQKAAYFADIEVVDQSGHSVTPVGLETDISRPDCYDLLARTSRSRGEMFYFGGPGFSNECP